jgi:hypothetical protein
MNNAQLTCTWISVVDTAGRERMEAVWTTRPAVAHASHAA